MSSIRPKTREFPYPQFPTPGGFPVPRGWVGRGFRAGSVEPRGVSKTNKGGLTFPELSFTIPRMPSLAKVRYTHDAIIDMIVANPSVSQGELARHFGFTEAWMSIIVNSDAFKFRLEERKAELIDPIIKASIEERLNALAKVALDKLMDRVEGKNGVRMKDSDLIQAAKLGVGNKNALSAPAPQEHNLYVVHIPPPATNPSDWLASRSDPRGPVSTIETSPGVYSPSDKD